jgi:ATP-dependent DNA helicase HFM1/MER3
VRIILIFPYGSTAPTGSGKTVIMELAIIRTLLNRGTDSKIIYMAPTKSLCSERARDWQAKFKPYGIDCNILIVQLL